MSAAGIKTLCIDFFFLEINERLWISVRFIIMYH